MSDILGDALAWLAALPERIGTHWPECHTGRHHAPCLVRKMADEITRLRGSTVEQRFCEPQVAGSTPAAGFLTDAEREAVEKAAAAYQHRCDQGVGLGNDRPTDCGDIAATLRGLLARLSETSTSPDARR